MSRYCFFYLFCQSSRYVSNEQPCLKNWLYEDLLLLSSLFHFFYFIFSAPISGEGNGNILQYSCLENPMDREAWWAAVHGVAQSMHALETDMASHSNILLWRIPGTEEPGELPCMGSHSRTRLKQLSSSSSSHFF